eukprot:evm.model.scf_709EXC.7 EVM.evm.TU.scf_709EXC.7   scf_709EXC:50963-59351(+)
MSKDSEDFVRRLESAVTEFTLPSGLRFLVLERHIAPVVSCHTYMNVGAFDEEDGKTGIAHLLEHLLFKGSETIGSLDYSKESTILDKMDEAFYNLLEAKKAGNPREVLRLSRSFEKLQVAADKLVVPNAFGSLLEREGAVGVNASTDHDATNFYTALPANKLELWFALESARLQTPVFRQLYSEKRVVSEERQLRVESAPFGKYQEQFNLAALANNYRRPIIGVPEDLDSLGRREVTDFFAQHYQPCNATIAIVGDVDPGQVERFAERYFGSWTNATTSACKPVASLNSADSTEGLPIPEAVLSGETKELRRTSKSGPAALMGFYRPPLTGQSGVLLDAIREVLVGGRTARMIKDLVIPGVALSAQVVTQYPGAKHAGLVLAYGIPGRGRSVDDVAQDLKAQLSRIADSGVTRQELQRVKKSLRFDLFQLARSNSSLAASLCVYSTLQGSWRSMLEELDAMETVTGAQIQEVAAQTFREDNCFSGFVEPLETSEA